MCSLIDILQWKKNQKGCDDFWHRKLALKVKFWYFLTATHYSNFQNLAISFEYSGFLAKNLSNFISLPWKLHNRECHNGLHSTPISTLTLCPNDINLSLILKMEHYKPAWFSWGKTIGSFLWVATVLQSTVQTLPLAGKTLTSIETKARR